jgi:hypothetical protein
VDNKQAMIVVLQGMSADRLRKTWDGKTAVAERDVVEEEIVALIRAEYQRRNLSIPEEAPKLPLYSETRVEWAVRTVNWLSDAIGNVPHRRDPPDPRVEAVILERWLAKPESFRAILREAMGVLNIPMQENLP